MLVTLVEAAPDLGYTRKSLPVLVNREPARWPEPLARSLGPGRPRLYDLEELRAAVAGRTRSSPTAPREHGDVARYRDGCRCGPCRAGYAAYYARFLPKRPSAAVPAAEAREVVQRLVYEHGSVAAVARATGLGVENLRVIAAGRRRRYVRAETIRRLG